MKKRQTKKSSLTDLAIAVVLCISICIPAIAADKTGGAPGSDGKISKGERIVAEGEGLTVTMDEVEALIELMEKSGFESSEREHIKAAVKLALFSEEAEAMGIALTEEEVRNNEKLDFEPGGIDHKWYNKERYYYHVFQTYPFSDAAMESYFWANPERFEETVEIEGADGEIHKVKDMPEYDEEMKKKIRRELFKARFPLIVHEEFERLKEKYNVRICGKGGCG